MTAIVVIVAMAVAAVAFISKLFWPKQPHETGAEENWAQHNELRTPSLEQTEEAPYDNVEKGFNIAFKGGEY